MTYTSKQICLTAYPRGMPTPENFELETVQVPDPGEGEITVRNHWMSVDPYMRGRMSGVRTYIDPFEIGKPLEGGAVGEIIASGHDKYKVGDWVLTMKGWREIFTAPVAELEKMMLQKIDPGLIPPQAFLGVAGMPGLTAYAGLYKVAEYKPGETVLVSAASGAVGSTVCQLAKADGGFVVGLAGSDEKCKWLESHGCDSAINYKTTENLTKAIHKAAPGGIDVYFENVGGAMLEAALNNMKMFGRIAACGMISAYNDEKPQPGPSNLVQIVAKSLRMQGFIVSNYQKYALEYFAKLGPLMASGKLVPQETVVEGVEQAPEAFLRLFSGDKQGKMLVKLV
ncbi:MAG TPA: NADP-dependent oxidoreductase [Hellea balneolensis]|uniref:NADP-dependent oxidoreductase n=1 Tax=Hellea balneolensis TaxID=287478 RepID=A0A7V5NXD9_9PROT|nr:NADP-dependent oxidoreductase [Hellea balneolensis]